MQSAMQALYGQLEARGLAQRRRVRGRVSQLSESDLADFLQACVDLAERRPVAQRAVTGLTDVFPDSENTALPISLVKQLALYANRIYLHDPFVPLAFEQNRLGSFEALLQVGQGDSREASLAALRQQVAETVECVLDLRPLVEADVIYFTPAELQQSHRDPNALYADSFFGPDGAADEALRADALPPALQQFCRTQMLVSPARLVSGHPVALPPDDLAPCRFIAVRFRQDPASLVFFPLYQITPEFFAETAGDDEPQVDLYLSLTDTPDVDEQTFWKWVEATTWKVALRRLTRVQHDLLIAERAHAQFLTADPVTRDLLQLDLTPSVAAGSLAKLCVLLQLDLPYLDQATPATIAQARQNEGAFYEFRIALDQALKMLQTSTPPADLPAFQAQVDEVTRDLVHGPLIRVRQQLRTLEHRRRADWTFLLGRLALTLLPFASNLLTPGTPFVQLAERAVTGGFLLSALKDFQDRQQIARRDRDAVRTLMGFFYWQATHQRL